MEKKHTVGIFSRSDRKDYSWLISVLTSQHCSDWVQDVRSTVISNTLTTFIGDASRCTFGILYHTKNRGGVNISDITGSLYDEEMKILHDLLGKENVIVVIDDLKDSSYEEKRRILNIQPSIETLACDLLLISNTEKTNTTTLVTKLKNLRPFHSTSEKVTEAHTSHDGKDNIKIKTPNFQNKNPEILPRFESPKTWNNSSEVQMNVCAPVMSSRVEDDEEEEHIYMNIFPFSDSFGRLARFDNPYCSDNIESLQNSSSNENLREWDRSGSCETWNRNEGLETLDTGNLYVDPKVPFSDELFEEMLNKVHNKQNSETQPTYKTSEPVSKSSVSDELFKEMLNKVHNKQNSETQPTYKTSETVSKSSVSDELFEEMLNKVHNKQNSETQPTYKTSEPVSKSSVSDELFEEMLTKVHNKQNSETQPTYKNSETVSKSEKPPTWWNHKNLQSTCNDKSPEKHSNSPKRKAWFYDENAQTWCRNEDLETLSSDTNPKTPSTSTAGSYVPQPSKGNFRTQIEPVTKNKSPERRSNNENKKWYFNESSQAWCRN
ncbi:uncharacterized protein LOC120942578 isoform X2 [Rana temporaria]|uniref:uncharacterized protein LOC120942578 isoform X2 n=1 Tax=Rana temporaria TaxID=8407 RepID=UPI001AACF3F6|nr:uncharacterized protein LOC120942578 isoform X2 [Rana temporaria]